MRFTLYSITPNTFYKNFQESVPKKLVFVCFSSIITKNYAAIMDLLRKRSKARHRDVRHKVLFRYRAGNFCPAIAKPFPISWEVLFSYTKVFIFLWQNRESYFHALRHKKTDGIFQPSALMLEYFILLHCHFGIVSGVCNVFFNLSTDSLNICIFYALLHNIFKHFNSHIQSAAQNILSLLVHTFRCF